MSVRQPISTFSLQRATSSGTKGAKRAESVGLRVPRSASLVLWRCLGRRGVNLW